MEVGCYARYSNRASLCHPLECRHGIHTKQKLMDAKALFLKAGWMRDIYEQGWRSDSQKGGTRQDRYLAITSGILKSQLFTQLYLEEIKSKADRRTLARFQTGSHTLPIETERWSNEAQECTFCAVLAAAPLSRTNIILCLTVQLIRVFAPTEI